MPDSRPEGAALLTAIRASFGDEIGDIAQRVVATPDGSRLTPLEVLARAEQVYYEQRLGNAAEFRRNQIDSSLELVDDGPDSPACDDTPPHP